MGTYRVTRHVLIFCSINLYLMRPIVAVFCDFGDPHGLLSNNALARCYMDIDDLAPATVICPRRINDTEYVWHPQPKANENSQVKTYLTGGGMFRSVALSHVLRYESENVRVWAETTLSQSNIRLNLPKHELFAMTERRVIFICGPKDLVLSDALQRHLDHLDGFGSMQPLPWIPVTPLTEELSKIGHGLGVFYLNRGNVHLPFQGCGTRPSPLFVAHSAVTANPVTGTVSCVADPMSKSPIGFVCEGRIEPDDCMMSLLETNSKVVKAPQPYLYWKFDDYRPWVAARYFNEFALPPIKGECRCVDPVRGDIKARIVINFKTDYVCDISSKIFRDRHRSIIGPWCDVVLHPGSTLTIKVPTQPSNPISMGDDYDRDIDGDASGVPFSQLPSAYEYETEFLPNNLATLRQLKSMHDIDDYDEVWYNKTIAGDALELDVSQMSRGEVKLKYHLDKPLALRTGLNSFVYHWTLISKNQNVPDKIRATVNLSFAYSYRYVLLGCDRTQRDVFDRNMSMKHSALRSVENGIGLTYECSYRIASGAWQVGIYCSPHEELLPDNCESKGYDLYSNRVMLFPRSISNVSAYPMRGFQVFDIAFRNTPVSHACICVDQLGYEKSKLILESSRHIRYAYTVLREQAPDALAPFILLPWHEMGFSIEGLTTPRAIALYHAHYNFVTLHVGTTLFMNCESDVTPLLQVGRSAHLGVNPGTIPTKWLPEQPNLYYYNISHMHNGSEVVKTSYDETLSITPGGFQVIHNNNLYTTAYQRLTIESRRGAIIISKNPDNTKYVPMTFVCGKAPEASDLSTVTAGASTSEAPPPPDIKTIGSLTRYTWNLVEVAVEMTDPYMQGCGVTYSSTELFKPETPKLYDADGELQFGCQIDIQAAKEAAFYCPAPYALDPPNCFNHVSVDGELKNLSDISQSLVDDSSNHFVILRFDSELIGPGETLRKTPPLECRCVTTKGIVLSTIQIENYYAK
ncbi:hypothetical protein BBBOND_0302080 [Babesia bigemina]|uniref:6-Cys domain-containing protein n=1 Tax=Babesia bigemina TaxID=5866 RepID=A0A061DBR5_BABBI|nr:hypothetical protein BBBOND_0302080 [Babesia bigemina]CDR96304.1 hypothetical protein BBBOND_0302080 [Babesia bigemina]|eukprot:XP_012768490.1 hypothetical protein BBBOND_0302080 [Babesia bigemina]